MGRASIGAADLLDAPRSRIIEVIGLQRKGILSERNGDKARFAKQRHSKILLRKSLRDVWKAMSLENKTKTIRAELR